MFIGVKRIIAVDSSEFAYAELDVDAHCMLVAQGNVGKSSLINALRLFFLPECSLAHQAKVFGFANADGEPYSSEETFQHYFPSAQSFLILEYEKRVFDGPNCCQIITASGYGRLKLERMFTTLAFDELRHLFWTQDITDMDGIGIRNDDLRKKNLYDYIQQHDKHCVLAKQEDKVAHLIYQSDMQASRYTLFPLKEPNAETVDALRALIKLIFVASDKNKTAFIIAIANIIESGKKSAQDQFYFDIDAFKQRHEGLKRQESELNMIANFAPKVQTIQKQHEQFIDYLAMLRDVRPGQALLEKELKRIKQDLGIKAEQKSKYDIQFADFQRTMSDIKTQHKLFISQRKELGNEYKGLVHELQQIQKLDNEYHGMSRPEIKAILTEEHTKLQSDVDAMQDATKRDVKIAAGKTIITQYEQKLKEYQNKQHDDTLALANQLAPSQLEILHSVNPLLATAHSSESLSIEQQESISKFCQLFSKSSIQQGLGYQFFDAHIIARPYQAIDWDREISKIETEIASEKKSLNTLQQSAKSILHKQHDEQALTKKIKNLACDIQTLSNAEYNEKRYDIVKTNMAELEEKIAQVDTEVDKVQTKFNKIDRKRAEASTEYNELQESLREQEALFDRLKNLTMRFASWLELVEDNTSFNSYINEQSLEMFENAVDNLASFKNTIIKGLIECVHCQLIKDEHGILGEAPTWYEINATLANVQAVYEHLDSQKVLLSRQIEEHNQTIGTKKTIIIDNYKLIQQFTREINQAFAGITINNVAAVEFRVGINPQFEALVQEFEEANLQSQQLLSDAFYERLVSFAEKFFGNSGRFTLTMDQVIQSFEPQVQLVNKSIKEHKKQSNSTNALIKLKLVQLLLKRLLAHPCETSLPVVFDEIANIDIGQFDWWLEDLSASGFKLMAAGTHSTSPALQAKIGRRHVVDAMHTAKPYHKERTRVYWNGPESFTT